MGRTKFLASEDSQGANWEHDNSVCFTLHKTETLPCFFTAARRLQVTPWTGGAGKTAVARWQRLLWPERHMKKHRMLKPSLLSVLTAPHIITGCRGMRPRLQNQSWKHLFWQNSCSYKLKKKSLSASKWKLIISEQIFAHVFAKRGELLLKMLILRTSLDRSLKKFCKNKPP